MTGPDKEVIKRRLGHVYAFLRGRAYIKKDDMAESAGGWILCRGLHGEFSLAINAVHTSNNSPISEIAARKLPEYGDKFQVHVQTPFDKLNLYTATLTIPGEDEPLLHTKFCRTPVEALSNLRIMIMVCEDPNTKAKREEEQRKKQERPAEEKNAEQENDEGLVDSENLATKQHDDAMRAEQEALDREELAREQWDSTLAQLGGMKSRQAAGGRKRRSHAAE
ncbi:unnamed protein product [Aureobasidium mustum]|uniref:Uncharacterized protein n=1 Tax=Aureobasidium mustum TaxID=2773714 RepID=A0A9N8JT90_9PEZI|nr:unnamed protein product [Aureobasidium mustum]